MNTRLITIEDRYSEKNSYRGLSREKNSAKLKRKIFIVVTTFRPRGRGKASLKSVRWLPSEEWYNRKDPFLTSFQYENCLAEPETRSIGTNFQLERFDERPGRLRELFRISMKTGKFLPGRPGENYSLM